MNLRQHAFIVARFLCATLVVCLLASNGSTIIPEAKPVPPHKEIFPEITAQPAPPPAPKPTPHVEPEKPHINCRSQSCIALTFDDGPSPHTNRLLDVLHDMDAKATFYMLGVYVERHADIVQRVHREGHQIGNHTWIHQNLRHMSDAEARAEIDRTNRIIQQVTGVKPDTMRAPFGISDERIQKVSEMPQILWSIDPYDWRERDATVVADRVLSSAERGAIVLVHDIYPTTVDAVPKIINGLRAKGLEPVTINQLLSDGATPPISNYYRQNF